MATTRAGLTGWGMDVGLTDLIRVHLRDSLHVHDLDPVRHDELIHPHFLPVHAFPQHSIETAQ